MCWLEFWLTIDCSLELDCLTARSEDGAETLPCLPPSPSYSSPNWWQAGSPSGPVSEYPTPLSCPPPLCGSPQLLAGLSHLSFRATTALEETLLCPPTLSTTQTLNLPSRPYFDYNEVLLFSTKNAKEPIRAAVQWSPSSKRASGLLLGVLSFWYWTKEGPVKKSPCILRWLVETTVSEALWVEKLKWRSRRQRFAQLLNQ